MKTNNPLAAVSSAFRNSPWIMISVSVHVIALAILAVWYIAKPNAPLANELPIVVLPPTHVLEPELVPDPVQIKDRNLIPPERDSILTSEPVDPNLETIPITAPPDPDTTLGDPDANNKLLASPDTSTATGPGNRGHRGREHGIRGLHFKTGDGTGQIGNTKLPGWEMDKLVLDGLRWLARHQNADGSWSTLGLRDHCSADQPCADPKQAWNHNYDEGLTGMALLAYLGCGFSHESQQWLLDPITHQRWQVGDVVKNGLRWLKSRQNPDGSFSRERVFLYNEALATLALTEAYGLTHNRYWLESAQRGIEFLERAQRPNPSGQGLWGWRYASRQEIEAKYPGGSLDETGKKELFDADLSVSGWAVMALKSAQLSQLKVEPGALEGALAFAKWVSTPEGLAGYLDPKGAGAKVSGVDDQYVYHSGSMSALSMCIRAFSAHDPADAFLEPAAKRIASDLPKLGKDGLETDYYYWYYGSLALHQFDGPDSPRHSGRYWGPWNEAMVEALKTTQSHDLKSCHDGGWLIPDRWSHSGGPVYATAINVLTAEVYYRYANAFGGRRR